MWVLSEEGCREWKRNVGAGEKHDTHEIAVPPLLPSSPPFPLATERETLAWVWWPPPWQADRGQVREEREERALQQNTPAAAAVG